MPSNEEVLGGKEDMIEGTTEGVPPNNEVPGGKEGTMEGVPPKDEVPGGKEGMMEGVPP